MDINLLGTSFKMETNEENAYLEQVVTRYRKIVDSVQETTSNQNEHIVAILAGLLAVDELLRLQKERTPVTEPIQTDTIQPIVKSEETNMPDSHARTDNTPTERISSAVSEQESQKSSAEEAQQITENLIESIEKLIN